MTDPTTEFARLAALTSGHVPARAIQTALELGLFEALESSGKDAGALASALQCAPRGIAILADALVALELLAKEGDHYRLADAARRFLTESSPQYLGAMIRFEGALFGYWEQLSHAVRTGAPVRTPDMFQSRREDTERFITAMDSLTRARGDARYLAEHLDLSGVELIADVGGGPGTYMAALVRQRPNLRAVMCDLPATLEVARRILSAREADLLDRIELRAVNYLTDELPGPCDALFVSNVIHAEDPSTNQMLVAKCWRALRPGGQLIFKDHIMSRDLTGPVAGALFSLQMLLMTRGRDYSFEEVARWARAAGFDDIRVVALPSPPFNSSLVIARKP